MKYLRSFNESLGGGFLTDVTEIETLLKKWDIRNYTIRPNGVVDVKGDVKISFLTDYQKLPIRFGTVTGKFFLCGINLSLTTMEGCPEKCGEFELTRSPFKEFRDRGEIRSLVGGPKYVRGNYQIGNTAITTLQGGPRVVGGWFNCRNTKITSLVGGPKYVGESYDCSGTSITNLKGVAERMGEGIKNQYGSCWMSCQGTRLTSLNGLPKGVQALQVPTLGRTLFNPTPLKDSTLEKFHCHGCEENGWTWDPIARLMECFNTSVYSYIQQNDEKQKQIFRTFLDSLDYNYMRGDDKINLFRFKEALSEFDIEKPRGMGEDGLLPHYTFVDDDGVAVNFWGVELI